MTGLSDLELIACAQAGGADALEARNALVMRHYAFICFIARRACRGEDPTEHLSHAVEAYIAAIRMFKPDRGANLNTFATLGMERRVWRARNVSRGAIYVPQSRAGKKWDGHREKAFQMRAIVHACQVAAPEEDVCRHTGAEIDHALSQLDERERRVFLARVEGVKLRELAETEGVCRERIRQIEDQAIKRLRKLLQ